MIIERKYCQKCRTETGLHLLKVLKSKTGNTIRYYICRPCNAKKASAWYKANRLKQMEYNRRYRARKAGLSV